MAVESLARMDAQVRGLVLVVDDDARSARLLAKMLRDDGFDAEVATDGAAAIARLSRAPVPDALVTDYRMPYADGMAVARYARSRCCELPVFIVTGYPDLVPRVRPSLDPPPMTLHNKPLDYDTLLSELRQVLLERAGASQR
jgi:two-component system response regulator MprA